MRAIRAVTPAARLIQTDDCGRTFGTRRTRAPGGLRERSPLADVGPADRPRRPAASAACLSRAVRRDADRARSLSRGSRAPRRRRAQLLRDERSRPRSPPRPLSAGHARRQPAHRLRRRRGGAGARTPGIVGHRAHLLDAWRRYGIRRRADRGASRLHARGAGAVAARGVERRAGGARRRGRGRRGRAVGAARLLRLGLAGDRRRAATTSRAPSTSARADAASDRGGGVIGQLARGERPDASRPRARRAGGSGRNGCSIAPARRMRAAAPGGAPAAADPRGRRHARARLPSRGRRSRGLPAFGAGRRDVDITDVGVGRTGWSRACSRGR